MPDARPTVSGAVVSQLSADETAALIARLEPLPDPSAHNAAAPAMRAPSAAPPRPGSVQPIAFVVPSGKPVGEAPQSPAPIPPPTPSKHALAPPRIAPQGEVAAASEVQVVFDEPIVPLAAVGIAARPPAAITPAVAGSWRWLDTRVLKFTAASARLPGATDFAVTVPAGTRAVSGAALAVDATARLSTRPVQIVRAYPETGLRSDSPIAIKLDQAFDPDRLLPFLRVQDDKGKRLPWRPIALAEAQTLWAKNPATKFDASQADKLLGTHHLIIAPSAEWPGGASIHAVLGARAPSREGPRLTTAASDTSASIAPRFKVKGISCGPTFRPRMTGAICPAGGVFEVDFSTPIEPNSYRSRSVQIEGTPFQDHPAPGTGVSLQAPDTAGRPYTVTVDDSLIDIHGQPLVGNRRPSFTTGPARFDPWLDAPAGLQVLDPRFSIPQWVITAQAVTSVHVQLFQVQPNDYFAFQDYEAGRRTSPPGRRVIDQTYVVGSSRGADIRVDLRPALAASGTGHVVAIATASPSDHARRDWFDRKSVAWIQVTRLGLSARLDSEKISGWVHDITPAKLVEPRAGVAASLLVEGRSGAAVSAVSDETGRVGFDLLPPVPRKPLTRGAAALLVARAGEGAAADTTFMAISSSEKAIRSENALWYVTDDRFIYKPGEKVYVKGWLRWTHNGINPTPRLPAAGEQLTYTLTDLRGTKLAEGAATLSAQGGFDLAVALPANAKLGYVRFDFTARGARYMHPIRVQEFRTPAFAVNLNDDVSHAGGAPLILGESIEMNASAQYYAGGGLGGARVEWAAKLSAAWYRPPGWELFDFSPARSRDDDAWRSRPPAVERRQIGSLSATSSAGMVFDITALPASRPSMLEVDATITDVDRMSIRASSRAIPVHPSAYYVGLRLQSDNADNAANAGNAGVLEVVVTDIDGRPVTGAPVDVKIEGVLGSERYRDDAKVVDAQACNLRSAAAPVTCPFKRAGADIAYSVRASVADGRGRVNTAGFELPWYTSARSRVGLEVIPDRKRYRVGDVARLEIRSAVLPARAVVTFARNGVIEQKPVALTAPSTFVQLPIQPAFTKNVFVVVDRWGKRQRTSEGSALPLPEHAAAEVNLEVDVASARLSVEARPTRPLVEPGEAATFEVTVKHAGKPAAGAEVALIVVDEAVLALAGSSHEDPLGPFYREVVHGTTHQSTIDLIRDAGRQLDGAPGVRRYGLDLESVIGSGSFGLGGLGTIGKGSAGGAGNGGVVTARKDFRANAVFSPRLRTGADGRVALTVKMPDSLTRFRVIALAAADTLHFGKGEGTIVTQRKINARTIAPRFLTQGDVFSLPVLVQNLDARPRTVDVAVRAANLAGRGPAGKRVTIPGGQRAEVRFDFATRSRGKAVVQTITTAGDFADASNVEVPIYEPATTEAFATYGTVDDAPRFEQLAVPDNVFRDVGGVEVELASTQLQSLTDAFWYVYRYPHECAEQRSSRMLATAAVGDILELFQTPGRPTRSEVEATRAKDVQALGKDQRPDGGWGYFHGMKSDPYVTMQVLQALAAQGTRGDITSKATRYVAREAARLLGALERSAATPPARRKDAAALPYHVSLAATALATLAAAGQDARPRAERLHALARALGVYPMDARARLLSLVAGRAPHQKMRATLLAELLAATHQTASSATVTVTHEEAERLLLVSATKTDALVLDALIREKPDLTVVTKLARGVLDGRRNGRWRSTQENLVALQAIRRYFDTFEKATPDYTGKLWLGAAAYAEQTFAGRSNARGTAGLDWNTLLPGSTHDVALAKVGAGRMYYRVGITYAPKQIDLPALDAGFVVRRSYTAVEDPADVVRLGDGRVKIRLGAKVLVTLEAFNTTRRYNVALVDPLPAGFETVNEELATAERAVAVAGDAYWDHRNLRDNRSEAFAMDMAEGSHRFSYTVRATTPGTFIAAPAKAEEMYSPETFGRSSGQTVVIE